MMHYKSSIASSATEEEWSSFDTTDNHRDTWDMASPHVL